MKVTAFDELKDWLRAYPWREGRDCDRIMELMGAVEDERMLAPYTLLPRDASGRAIRPRDIVDYYAGEALVWSMNLSGEGWLLELVLKGGTRYSNVPPSAVQRKWSHADTFERVVWDAISGQASPVRLVERCKRIAADWGDEGEEE